MSSLSLLQSLLILCPCHAFRQKKGRAIIRCLTSPMSIKEELAGTHNCRDKDEGIFVAIHRTMLSAWSSTNACMVEVGEKEVKSHGHSSENYLD